MKEMNLTVVIPVSSDPLLETALDSINERVEVIISLNAPNKQILDIVDCWIKKKLFLNLQLFPPPQKVCR